MESGGFWIAAVTAVFALGLGKGGVPVIAALAVPILSLVINPIVAAGLLLPLYIVTDMFALGLYRRDFDHRVLKIALVTMPIGVAFGWATASLIPVWAVTLLVGVIGVSFVVRQYWQRHDATSIIPVDWQTGGLWCAIAGFTSFISHSGGPPWQIWTLRLGLSRDVYVGTSVWAFAYVNAVKLIPYYFLGQLSLSNLYIASVLVIPAVLAVWTGRQLVKITPEQVFFRIVNVALLVISMKLCWDGLKGLLA